jgi:hypothetical protein
VTNDRRKGGRGRVTPKKGAPDPGQQPSPGARRSIIPKRIGPFDRPDRAAPLGQVGRRPSSPGKLFLFAAVYFGAGVAAFFVLTGSLGIIVGVVLIGISLLWLRGASTALLRQQRRQ